jgi:hypothetical protein
MNAAAAAAAAGAGGEDGGALLEVVGSVEAELKALMDAKPSWEQLEEALAAKGDLDKVLAKADAGYVEEMFKSLSASMESQLHELRQAAESGVAGAAEELEAQSEKWAALQAELLDKAGRDDLRALEQQMLGKLNRVTKRLNSQSGVGHPGGAGTEAGSSSRRRGRQSDEGGLPAAAAAGADGAAGEMGAAMQQPTAEELAALQRRLEQRLNTLQSIFEHRASEQSPGAPSNPPTQP